MLHHLEARTLTYWPSCMRAPCLGWCSACRCWQNYSTHQKYPCSHLDPHLEKQAQLHAGAVLEVVVRVQMLRHERHAQREGGPRQARHLPRSDRLSVAARRHVAVVGAQVPGSSRVSN